MKSSFYYKITFQIAIIFIIMIFANFIPDHLRSFFGDWYCQGSGNIIPTNSLNPHYTQCDEGNYHLPTWHWGARHWLYFSMVILLAIVQAIRIVDFVNKSIAEANKKVKS